jgi:hypothetical protein
MKAAAINICRHEFLNFYGLENASLLMDTIVAYLGFNFEDLEFS